MPNTHVLTVAFVLTAVLLGGCSGPNRVTTSDPASPPAATQAWMDRLTVDHEYDPETGFIVARETITLPDEFSKAATLDAAIETAEPGQVVIAFATADRCAPCQQYKRDALNDPAVLERLADARFVPTHVEVDREPEIADTYLGSRAIPMTYAIRDGERIAELRGQRSAAELLAWLDQLPG